MRSAPLSIDLVIPSFRLSAAFLRQILQLAYPSNAIVRYYIVIDNPAVTPPQTLEDGSYIPDHVQFIQNPANLGFSASRNIGTRAGEGGWVLYLDDDILPSRNLITAYATAIAQYPDAIGFAGPTLMPSPFNVHTKALELLGVNVHFQKPKFASTVPWTPTANVMIRRDLIRQGLFGENLVWGGEDIALLTQIALAEHQEWRCVPDAEVVHPWWNNGTPQFRRMHRYGRAAADIMPLPHIRPYTWTDFPNAIEWTFFLLVTAPFWLLAGSRAELGMLFLLIWGAEWLTLVIQAFQWKRYTPDVAFSAMLQKASRDAGQLIHTIRTGHWRFLCRRLDAGFKKPHPSSFRLNRWKFMRGILIILGLLFLIAVKASF